MLSELSVVDHRAMGRRPLHGQRALRVPSLQRGGPVVEVSSVLDRPRGCAWDGDGTVYVADRGAGRVYSLPSNMHILSRSDLSEAFEYDDAFGLAVLTGGALRAGAHSLVVACFAAVLSMA